MGYRHLAAPSGVQAPGSPKWGTGTWQPQVQAPDSPKGDGESTQAPDSPMRDSSICERSWSFHLAMVIHSHLHMYIYLQLWWRGFKSKTEALRAGWLSHWGDLSSRLSFICIIHKFTELRACQIFTKKSWGHVRYSQRRVKGMSHICHHWRTH